MALGFRLRLVTEKNYANYRRSVKRNNKILKGSLSKLGSQVVIQITLQSVAIAI